MNEPAPETMQLIDTDGVEPITTPPIPEVIPEVIQEVIQDVVEPITTPPIPEVIPEAIQEVDSSIDHYAVYFPNGSETDEEYKEEEARLPSSIVAEESSTADNNDNPVDTDDDTDDGNLIIEQIRISQTRKSIDKFIKLVNSTEDSPLKCSMLVDAKHAELIAVSSPEKKSMFRYCCCF
jgi:hypothetical protein